MNSFFTIHELRTRIGKFDFGPLSLELARGDYLVLLGPSGCGKTTLLKMIAGVVPPVHGTIEIDGQAVQHLPPQKRNIGYVSQTVDLFPHLRVSENIGFGLRYQPNLTARQKQETIARFAELIGITQLLDRYPETLSGGETRRVGLARSLAVGPGVLLLDEPLSMLDPNARSAMLDTLKRLHDELQTVTIHVTHDREEAWTLGMNCSVMLNGKILQTGTTEILFRQPASVEVAAFLGGYNLFDANFGNENGSGRADLGWCVLPLAKQPGYETGAVQIRPEVITLATPTAGNVFATGRVQSVSDRGLYTLVQVAVENGPVLVVSTTARTGLPAVADYVGLECMEPVWAMSAG